MTTANVALLDGGIGTHTHTSAYDTHTPSSPHTHVQRRVQAPTYLSEPLCLRLTDHLVGVPHHGDQHVNQQ